jgi:hypothetical protein
MGLEDAHIYDLHLQVFALPDIKTNCGTAPGTSPSAAWQHLLWSNKGKVPHTGDCKASLVSFQWKHLCCQAYPCNTEAAPNDK